MIQCQTCLHHFDDSEMDDDMAQPTCKPCASVEGGQ